MTFAARIYNGVVVEVVELPADVDLADAFHPDAGFVEGNGAVEVGMIYADGEFSPPQPPPPPTKAELLAYAGDMRWRRETGGITVAGVAIATDDRSKAMIVGARVAAEANGDWSTNWHGADGQIYPIDSVTMIAISAAVEAHVNSGFATFAAVKADIEAGTITTRAEIDAAFA